MTKPTKRLRTATGFAAILSGILLSMVALTLGPADASVKVPAPVAYNGNLDCATLGYAYEFKIDKQPTAGTYAVGDPGVVATGAVPPGTTITISNVESPNGRMEFDWSSNQAWGALLVKQGNEGLRYDYNPAATDDQNVQTVTGANQGGISHVSFCGPGPVPPPPPPPPPPPGPGPIVGPVVVPVVEPVVEPVTPPVTPPQVLPEVITPPVVPEAPAEPVAEVAGVVVTRELPRTGSTTLPLLEVGLGLILLGAGAVLFGRERTALI